MLKRDRIVGPSLKRGTPMEYYAGIDVSLKESSVCVVDATGKLVPRGQATLRLGAEARSWAMVRKRTSRNRLRVY